MNKFALMFMVLFFASCITTTKNQLPDLKTTQLSTNKKINLKFNTNLNTSKQRDLYQAFKDAGFANNVYSEFQLPIFFKEPDSIKEFNDFFPVRNVERISADLNIIVTWETAGFFEPYCVVLLTIIPCTPPYNWTLGFRVSDKDGRFIKDYIVEERFVLVYWLGFLTPDGWSKGSKVDPILANAIKNLMDKLKQDNLI